MLIEEHPDTLKLIREDYRAKVIFWLSNNLERHDLSYDYPSLLDNSTTLQLRSLVKLIDRDIPDLVIKPSNPLDHLVVSFANMYIGIELDGYTHS